jgi:dihydrofolate reductase
MRIVTYGGAVSLDGFLAAADGAIDWLHHSKDSYEVMADYWKTIDTYLVGRKTYEFAAEMTRGKASPWDPALKNYVFSRTLKEIADPHLELIDSDAVSFVRDLKQQPGGGICLMGGGELATSLLAAGLVDRIGLNIHPILLGSGIPTFRDAGKRVKLKTTECRPMDGGCILAQYDVIGEQA